jgi:hypothetical protein
MPGVLNQTATIMCIHGGQVTIIPKPNPILLGGVPVLFATDLVGCPVAGCPVPVTPGSGPCVTVAAPPVNWASPLLTALGMPALGFMPGVPGGMTAGPTPGPLICVQPGQTLVV